mmetsp:Transcript_22133/g.87169  ORF Transcript_22133/g.87169 Transcript_22133/m.87169 type:complete len:209 (-) Transcript_22133:64-690(-)
MTGSAAAPAPLAQGQAQGVDGIEQVGLDRAGQAQGLGGHQLAGKGRPGDAAGRKAGAQQQAGKAGLQPQLVGGVARRGQTADQRQPVRRDQPPADASGQWAGWGQRQPGQPAVAREVVGLVIGAQAGFQVAVLGGRAAPHAALAVGDGIAVAGDRHRRAPRRLGQVGELAALYLQVGAERAQQRQLLVGAGQHEQRRAGNAGAVAALQ